MADDVLDLDDCIVDEDTRHQSDAQQANKIEGKAQQIEHPKRRDDRKRQGNGGDDRCTKITQKQEHDEHRECRTFEEGLHGGIVVADRVGNRVVHEAYVDIAVFGLEFSHSLADALLDVYIAFALAAEYAERYDRIVVYTREGFRFGPGICDGGDIRQRHLAAIGERYFQRT